MKSILTEEDLENISIEWFKEIGYKFFHGPDIAPDSKSPERDDFRKVILEDRLRSTLQRLNPEVPNKTIDAAVLQITNSNIKEIIVATSPTVEGDATSFYIRDQIIKEEVKVTRIAYGVPMGGELEYVDNTTLGRAIQGRREIKE